MEKNIVIESNYWDEFYSKIEIELPSQFCALMASEINRNYPILEFGCGNGRDSLFLARHKYLVYAIDLSVKAVELCQNRSSDLENITFQQGDVSVESDVYDAVTNIKEKYKRSAIVVYSRFFLHSIDGEQEASFFKSLSTYLSQGDLIYLEFRSKEDEGIDKIYEGHFRRYIDTERFVKSLNNKYKFEITYCITGQGLAKYKSEDPFVSRVIATKI